MPKIEIAVVPHAKTRAIRHHSIQPCAERIRQRLGDAGGLIDFGVNLMHLPPSIGSSQHRGIGMKTKSSMRLTMVARQRSTPTIARRSETSRL